MVTVLRVSSALKRFRQLFQLTIGTKLVGLIAVLLITSVVSLVWLSTRMFSDDNTALIQQMNADKALSLSTQLRDQLESLTDKMRILGTVLTQNDRSADAREALIKEFFAKDKDFLALYVSQQNSQVTQVVSPEIQNTLQNVNFLTLLAQEKDFSFPQLFHGEVQITSLRMPGEKPLIAVGIPFIPSAQGDFTHVLTAIVKPARLVAAFSDSDIITTYLVDRKGKLLAHPDFQRVSNGENVSRLEIVKLLLQGKANNQQTRYVDPAAPAEVGAKLAAFRVVGFAGLGIVAEVAEAKAFEAAQRVKFRSMLVAFIILCASFLAGYLYSGTITWPIKQLVLAAGKISAGDFKINLKAKGRDEVAQLSRAFNEMAVGLEERDRVKDTFNKFHNKEIAEKLLSGEVKLGGERKEATIFFSDVRGFTGMSEAMEPEQVVEMLNEYMTRMVAIIRNHGGIVDKYVGDAIMALWGVPLAKGNDTVNAVRACIAMREELSQLNELRISRGQPALKIGMGLNTGSVIAGNIGSNEKMEYTVIGDSVNLASRIESMTKEYGTDCLISANVFAQVEKEFILEKCQSAKVKGKSQAIEIYKVRGYIADGREVIVETPYSSYAAEKSDKVVHDKPEVAEEIIAAETETATVSVITPPPFTHHVVGPNLPSAWFVQMGGEALGPFTTHEMIEGLRSQDFDVNVLVSRDGPVGQWFTAFECDEFTEVMDELTAPAIAA